MRSLRPREDGHPIDIVVAAQKLGKITNPPQTSPTFFSPVSCQEKREVMVCQGWHLSTSNYHLL